MVFSCRYHAKPSTPTEVMLPPKHPNRSISITLTPALAAAMAADSPPGPEPTTITSASPATGVNLSGSLISISAQLRHTALSNKNIYEAK